MKGRTFAQSAIVFSFASAMLASASAQQTSGQSTQLPQAPPTAAASRPAPPDAATDELSVEALALGEGITLEQARDQLSLETELVELLDTIDRSNNPQFAGIYLDRKPDFVVTLRHTGQRRTFESALPIPPRLKRFIRFEAAERNLASLRGQQQRMLNSPVFEGEEAVVMIDPRSNGILIRTPEPERMRGKASGSPDFAAHVRFEKGSVPPERAAAQPFTQYKPQAGDWMEGGQHYSTYYFDSNNAVTQGRGCTIAFTAQWGNTYGFLTAGHCEPPPAPFGTGYFHGLNGHWVELWGPSYEANGLKNANKFDFQFHQTPGFKLYNTVRAGSSGSVYWVDGIHTRSQQAAGTTCYYGHESGYFCGTITSNDTYIRHENGTNYGPWVTMTVSSPNRSVRDGDSGAPMISAPSGGYAKARGILSRGEYEILQAKSYLYYMPIDHIDDTAASANMRVLLAPSP